MVLVHVGGRQWPLALQTPLAFAFIVAGLLHRKIQQRETGFLSEGGKVDILPDGPAAGVAELV